MQTLDYQRLLLDVDNERVVSANNRGGDCPTSQVFLTLPDIVEPPPFVRHPDAGVDPTHDAGVRSIS